MTSIDVTAGDRDELQTRLRKVFPQAATRDDRLAPDRGGRAAALERLDQIEPTKYAKTRNHLDGAVTRLSPYLRHGCLTLPEVREAALAKVDHPRDAGKLTQELAWHDYFQRVYAAVGERGVWTSIESWKTGYGPVDYAEELPEEIEAGETGVDWVDHFARQLREEGWLHNHARMWLACYVVHARRVSWQAGAAWFLRHLVDGDPASNNLSWQWVASTFGAKPYFMNRENVVKNTGGRFAKHASKDPLDGSYEQLAAKLFPQGPDATQDAGEPLGVDLRRVEPWEPAAEDVPADAVVFVHDRMLRPNHPLLADGRPGVFVFDRGVAEATTLKPIAFICECLAELPNVKVVIADDVAAAVRELAEGRPTVTQASQSERTRQVADELSAAVVPPPTMVELDGSTDLKRFSRYWRSASKRLA